MEMRAMLSGSGDGDNSILCLTYLAGSINRIVAKLQRERILSAIKLTEKIERDPSNIDNFLQKSIASTDMQLKRTQETIKLLKVSKSCSERSKKLMQDGIDQFQFVCSKVGPQREQVVKGCASLQSCNSEQITVRSPLQSWCARYHLIGAGQTGYTTLIERLISWVSLAVCVIPHMGAAEELNNHRITQAGCVLVMSFKEQLSRERSFLASKSRSLMLNGGGAEKVFMILDNTRTSIIDAMKCLVSGPRTNSSPSPPTIGDNESPKVLASMEKAMGIDFSLKSSTSKNEADPPLVDMLSKFDILQEVLRDEEKNLPETDHTPPKMLANQKPSTAYIDWFQSTQNFFDLIEISVSGLMRHFALSVPADTACFPVEIEQAVPSGPKRQLSPLMGDLKSVGSLNTAELCDLSEGLVGEIMEGLCQKRYTKVVALVGAGISVAAGVPDFRSPGGLYDQMHQQGYEHPMSVFTGDFLREHPEDFYKIFAQIRTEHLSPTRAHEFLRLLEDAGCLLRCYTQNIDGLERKVGLPPERVIEAHGTMCDAHCLECAAPSTPAALWAEWENKKLPRCTMKDCNGFLRPAVVFFGERLNPRFASMSSDDLNNADLVLIMGTSLSVEPFASLVQRTPRATPRLLINRHVPYVMQRKPWELLTPTLLSKVRALRKDACILGECDDAIVQITSQLDWFTKEDVDETDIPDEPAKVLASL